jgi:hypothetical protein
MNQETNYFEDTQKKIKQYIQHRILLFRLQATDKASTVAATLITTSVIMVTALFLLIFASITAGYWLADLTGSLTAGFGIVALFYLVVFVLVIFFFRKNMQNFLVNKFIDLLNKRD